MHATFVEGASSGARGHWSWNGPTFDAWTFDYDELSLTLRCTPFGHVGVFPEQADNWDWIADCVTTAGRPLEVLNLFAYTGASTLAAAAERTDSGSAAYT